MVYHRTTPVKSWSFDPEASFVRVLLNVGPSAVPLTTPWAAVQSLIRRGLIERCGRELTGRGWKPAYRILNRAAAETWLENREPPPRFLFSGVAEDAEDRNEATATVREWTSRKRISVRCQSGADGSCRG